MTCHYNATCQRVPGALHAAYPAPDGGGVIGRDNYDIDLEGVCCSGYEHSADPIPSVGETDDVQPRGCGDHVVRVVIAAEHSFVEPLHANNHAWRERVGGREKK